MRTLNAILKEDAPELPAGAPAGLRQIITHCLEKNPARRFQTASDVAFALRSFATTTTSTQVAPIGTAGTRPVARRAGLWIAGAIAVAGLLAAGAWLPRVLAPRSITSGGDEAALWVGTPAGPLHRYEPPPVIIRSRVGPNVIRFSPDGGSILLWVTGGEPAV